MSLFQEKIIEKALGSKQSSIPEAHFEILRNWQERIETGSLLRQTEVAVHAPFTQNIITTVLGYKAFGSGGNWTVSREYGVAGGAVDLALGFFSDDRKTDRVLAPFELKGARTKDLDAIMPGRHKTPVQQAWDYARDLKGAQWVLVSNYIELRLYAVSETSLVYEKFNLAALTDPHQYARFILLLHADNLLSGNTAGLLDQSLLADKEITANLYDDYKSLRELLTAALLRDNPDVESSRIISAAQKLLDRFLFAAFAEDKGLIPEHSIQQAFAHSDPYNPHPVYENFKGLFRAIDLGNQQLDIPAYNGGLFASDEDLDHLTVADEVCNGVNELAKYDFDSEVSVTVLGHIFEQSIADLENLAVQVREGRLSGPDQVQNRKQRAVRGKRKQQGIVYTPDHITAFIVEHTLSGHVNDIFLGLLTSYGKLNHDGSIKWKRGRHTEIEFWLAWQDKLRNLKVVDPACGSGAFLVAAFDYLHVEYRRLNDKLAELTGQHSLFDLNHEILINNLYGVDINPESIEISKLSLWLKTAERGKPLTSLDANLLAGNSLALSEPLPGGSFSWRAAFPQIVAQGGFDVVLGNPPYVRQELFSDLKPWLEENFEVYNGVADLYTYFFELGHKLLKPGGRLGYISSSTFFKSGSGERLRRYLAEQVTLEKIVDFGDLQVFEGVTTYPAIIVLSKAAPLPENSLAFISLRERLPVNLDQCFAQEQASMPQARLGQGSWQLEDETMARLRRKLTQGHPTLKEVYGSPYRGVLTGLNAAFVIDRQTRDRLVSQDPRSEELLKPFLEGKDLKKWQAQPRGLWLIAIPKFWTRRAMGTHETETVGEMDAWLWLQQHYTAIAEWLQPFADKGRRRTDKGEYWWELRACVYYDEFAKPKIFYPDITDSAKFHLDISGAYSGNTGYFLPVNDLYVLGLLNSSVVWYFLTGISDSVRGGFYRLFSQNIIRIPIPVATDEQKKVIGGLAEKCRESAEQRYIIGKNFRRRLPDLCPQGRDSKLNNQLKSWWLLDFAGFQKQIKSCYKTVIPLAARNPWQDYFETEKAGFIALSRQIALHEEELNRKVYRLFNLSREEIALIEA